MAGDTLSFPVVSGTTNSRDPHTINMLLCPQDPSGRPSRHPRTVGGGSTTPWVRGSRRVPHRRLMKPDRLDEATPAAELAASCPGWGDAERYLAQVVDRLAVMVAADGVLYACGNGGSAADASHLVGELVKSFRIRRPLAEADRASFATAFGEAGASAAARLERGIRAVSLTADGAVGSAIANDCGADLVYAQQVWALARPGDVVLGLSTSGNSENVIQALRAARVKGATTVGLCGADPGRMEAVCDLLVPAPSTETFRVQEYHLAFYHAACAVLEQRVFADPVN